MCYFLSLRLFFCQKHNHKFQVFLYTFALLILILCQATKKLESIYLSSRHSRLAGKVLSDPKVHDERETHGVRNPRAPVLVQVAAESLGNRVGGGSGASLSWLARAELMNWTREETCGRKGKCWDSHLFTMCIFHFFLPVFPQALGCALLL